MLAFLSAKVVVVYDRPLLLQLLPSHVGPPQTYGYPIPARFPQMRIGDAAAGGSERQARRPPVLGL